MIEIASYIIIIFMNHVVNFFIIQQIIIILNNIDKLNLRSIRAFIYLSQFRLNVKYQLKKRHIISNILF